jgi:hypothetical protein
MATAADRITISKIPLRKSLRLKYPRVAEFCATVMTNLIDRPRWRGMTVEQRFTEVYEKNRWGSAESISGEGSTLEHTVAIREELPLIIKRLSIRSMLDIPCGDYNWMRAVAHGLESYIGADVVRALIDSNQERYSAPSVSFCQLDVTCDSLPRVDLVLCRDCLMHLSNAQVRAAIGNIVRSGSTWAALTSFHNSGRNRDTITGGFRALNLCQPPFEFPAPAISMDERWPPASNKFLDLWKIEDLRRATGS